jgi:RNA polymerase sigma-70 factor (ECF subfamily)
MLADDVRLDLVNRARARGRGDVARYFRNYGAAQDWRLRLGFVDRRPAVLVDDPREPLAGPAYFVLLGWESAALVTIRDFRYARYAIADAEVVALG